MIAVEGSALVALEQIRKSSAPVRNAVASLRAKTDLADLDQIIRRCNLPRPALRYSSLCGVVGTLRGTDKVVEYAVKEWAEAFAAEATVFVPVARMGHLGAFVDPGWAVMHATVRGLRFSVGGRLVEAVSR